MQFILKKNSLLFIIGFGLLFSSCGWVSDIINPYKGVKVTLKVVYEDTKEALKNGVVVLNAGKQEGLFSREDLGQYALFLDSLGQFEGTLKAEGGNHTTTYEIVYIVRSNDSTGIFCRSCRGKRFDFERSFILLSELEAKESKLFFDDSETPPEFADVEWSQNIQQFAYADWNTRVRLSSDSCTANNPCPIEDGEDTTITIEVQRGP